METALVKMQGIVKDFPGVRALDHVDFEVYSGEIHALIGENGAGKSTLIRILTGLYRADAGRIYIRGKPVRIKSPAEAEELGIACIHQEPALVPHFDVAANLCLGREPLNTMRLVDRPRLREFARNLLAELDIPLNCLTIAGEMTIGERQSVAICRALVREPAVLVLDEPTAPLSLAETERLFALLRRLKARGVGVIYISHRMREIFDIADRATVLRDGKNVGTVCISEADPDTLIAMMIGRRIVEMYPRERRVPGKELISVNQLSCAPAFQDVSFTLHAGEVVGIYGLAGAGQAELAQTLVGARQPTGGKILIDGQPAGRYSPREALHRGIALVPRERREEGLVLSMSLKENVTLPRLEKWCSLGFIRFGKERDIARRYVQALGIRCTGVDQEVLLLSGGNQQKVAIAKWLASNCRVLICDEPTRGIDVGAKTEIYAILNQLVRDGAGIILISSELPEIMSLADRILVMSRGKIVLDKKASETDADEVLSCALRGRTT